MQSNDLIPYPEQVRRASLNLIIQTKNREALWYWIIGNIGISIPKEKICPNHDAPFDMVCDIMFGDVNFAVVLANRSGGKTESFAVLDTLLSYYYDGVEIATVGAIRTQAEKCYGYFKNFVEKFPFNTNLSNQTMHKTDLKNKSNVQVLTGTMSGVNSPHPQILFVDEIDLMPWPILQQALSMPQSLPNLPSITVLTSTRKFAGGAMQRLMDDAPAKGYRVYQWCIWEVIEKLPSEQEALEKIRDIFVDELPKNIQFADGYYTWQDAINKKMSPMEASTWETEWLCRKPGLEGVIYGSSYSDEENLLIGWSPVGRQGDIYLWEDFGYGEGHPDVVCPVWIPPEKDRMVIFDERRMVNYSTDEIWNTVDQMLQEYGHCLPNKELGKRGTIRGWIADYHGLTEIADRVRKNAPMMDKNDNASLYLKCNGIPIVQRFFSSGRLMITDKVVDGRIELLSYKRKKNLDGTYSKEPEKKLDHFPDLCHYGVVRLGPMIDNKINAIISKKIEEKEQLIAPKSKIIIKDPITKGYLQEKF